jgi:hypothetical protein
MARIFFLSCEHCNNMKAKCFVTCLISCTAAGTSTTANATTAEALAAGNRKCVQGQKVVLEQSTRAMWYPLSRAFGVAILIGSQQLRWRRS